MEACGPKCIFPPCPVVPSGTSQVLLCRGSQIHIRKDSHVLCSCSCNTDSHSRRTVEKMTRLMLGALCNQNHNAFFQMIFKKYHAQTVHVQLLYRHNLGPDGRYRDRSPLCDVRSSKMCPF